MPAIGSSPSPARLPTWIGVSELAPPIPAKQSIIGRSGDEGGDCDETGPLFAATDIYYGGEHIYKRRWGKTMIYKFEHFLLEHGFARVMRILWGDVPNVRQIGILTANNPNYQQLSQAENDERKAGLDSGAKRRAEFRFSEDGGECHCGRADSRAPSVRRRHSYRPGNAPARMRKCAGRAERGWLENSWAGRSGRVAGSQTDHIDFPCEKARPEKT